MIYRDIGKTGKKAGIIGLGCEHLDRKPYEQVKATIDRALECGINLYDIFMPGRDVREKLAKAFGERRKDIMIQGHICSTDVKQQYDISRDMKTVRKYFEEHLKLCGGYIDFGMLFFIDSDEDYKNVFESDIAQYAQKLREKGDILHIGFSSHNPVTAAKAINTGLPELMMFSLNPAFDIVPSGDSVFTHLDSNFKGSQFAGLEPRRAELYRLCEQKNIAVTVMKPFAAGKLLSPEHTPFAKPLTAAQCVHYALSRPSVVSVLPGCRTPEEVDGVIRYLEADYDEKDYTEALSGFNDNLRGGCFYCSHCEPCPAGIDIAAVNKYLDIALLDTADIPPSAKSHYRALITRGADCTGCGSCERRCPFDVNIIANMKKAEELLR